MKFTLLPNDEIKFKIKKGWTFSAPEIIAAAPEIIADGTYYYESLKKLIDETKDNALSNNNWANAFTLELSKDKGLISYEIEDFQLNSQGTGNLAKVISVDVILSDKANKTKVTLNVERHPSLKEKITSFLVHITSGISKKLSEQKSKNIAKELEDKKLIEEIIEQKAKETITNEY